jgi:hypothetical protein
MGARGVRPHPSSKRSPPLSAAGGLSKRESRPTAPEGRRFKVSAPITRVSLETFDDPLLKIAGRLRHRQRGKECAELTGGNNPSKPPKAIL